MDAAVKLAKDPKSETAPANAVEESKSRVEAYGWFPCHLSLELPVAQFTVGDLLRLAKGSIVETGCASTSDIPLRANGLLIARTEFEVIGNRLAVRITELA